MTNKFNIGDRVSLQIYKNGVFERVLGTVDHFEATPDGYYDDDAEVIGYDDYDEPIMGEGTGEWIETGVVYWYNIRLDEPVFAWGTMHEIWEETDEEELILVSRAVKVKTGFAKFIEKTDV